MKMVMSIFYTPTVGWFIIFNGNGNGNVNVDVRVDVMLMLMSPQCDGSLSLMKMAMPTLMRIVLGIHYLHLLVTASA